MKKIYFYIAQLVAIMIVALVYDYFKSQKILMWSFLILFWFYYPVLFYLRAKYLKMSNKEVLSLFFSRELRRRLYFD